MSSYGAFLGVFYTIFGQDPIIGRLISVIFGSLVVLLVYMIAQKLNISTRISYILSAITALTPSYVIFSGLIMRDSLIWFLMYLFIYIVYKLYNERNKLRFLSFSLLLILPMILLRKQYAALFAVYFVLIIIHLITERDYYFKNLKINFIKSFFILAIFLIGLLSSYNIIIYELSTFDKSDLMEYLSSQISWRTQGGSAYLQDLEFSSLLDLAKNIPLKFYYFTYGPFLWSASSLFNLLAAAENMLVWLFSILFIKKAKLIFNSNNKNYKFIVFLFIFIFTSLAANALIDSNFGTAMRHRMVYIPLFFIVVMYGYKKTNLN